MDDVIWINGLIMVGWVSLLSAITIWSRKDTWMRGITIGLFILSIPVIGATVSDVLGFHKPLDIAWRLNDTKMRVLHYKTIKDKGIWLYVDVTGEAPRALSLPWDEKTAESFADAERESNKHGQKGFMLMYEPSLKNQGERHPLPHPIIPIPKGKPPTGIIYERK